MKQFISFIHIERAGGTSLHHLLHYNFKNYKTINPWYSDTNKEDSFFSRKNLKLLIKKFPKIEGIGGHTTRSFLDYEEIIDSPIFYFTFIREPISRYMSHFNYQNQVMKKAWSIEEFVEQSYFNNFQVKRIAGDEDVNKAFNELEKYSFVGLSENYNESLLLLKESLKTQSFIPHYEWKNGLPQNEKAVKFKSLTKEIQDKIIENNALDIELHKLVKIKIYKKQLKNYKGNISEELIEFENEILTFKYKFLKKHIIKFKKAYYYYLFEKKIVLN